MSIIEYKKGDKVRFTRERIQRSIDRINSGVNDKFYTTTDQFIVDNRNTIFTISKNMPYEVYFKGQRDRIWYKTSIEPYKPVALLNEELFTL